MTISRRTLLSSGGALLAASSISFPTTALALEGGSGLIIALLAAATVEKGEDAPKPVDLLFSDRELKELNGYDKREQVHVFSKMLIQKLSKAWGIKFDGIDGEAIDRAYGDKGLTEGENIVRLLSKGPKFEITIKIVIKF